MSSIIENSTVKAKLEEAVQNFSSQMIKKLFETQKTKGYGLSWKTCSIKFLRHRLADELEEYTEAYQRQLHKEECKELVDIANICMLLHDRLVSVEPPVSAESKSRQGRTRKKQETP